MTDAGPEHLNEEGTAIFERCRVNIRLACAFQLAGLFIVPLRHARSQEVGTGTVQGTITLSKSDDVAEEEHRRALLNRYTPDALEYGILADPKSWRPYRLAETTVVYLERESPGSAGPYTPPRVHPVLDQKGLRFHPQVLPVLVGTTVDFPNGDVVFHNVFSYSQPKEFDLGRYPMGDSRSVTFDRPGIVRVYCDIHSDMNATILVLNNPYFATPADDGTYILHDVPDGKYRMVVWHGRDVLFRRAILVKAGETTTVNIAY